MSEEEIKVKPKESIPGIEDKPEIRVNQELVNLFKPESDAITHNNMAKLTKQDSYLIGDKTFNRRRLKPKQLIEFTEVYNQLTSTTDAELSKKIELMEKSALIALEDFTHEDFENSEVVVLENVLAACFLITKGFREV